MKQIDDTHLHWVAEVGGERREWMPRSPSNSRTRVAWKATGGHGNSGVVTFQRLDDQNTVVTVRMEHEAEGLKEQLGSAIGADNRQVKGDLKRFKEFVESRGRETGAWRGQVESGRTRPLVRY